MKATDFATFIQDIWTMKADGAQQRDLTNSPLVDDFDPSWQPICNDGRHEHGDASCDR